jgi:hemoglobin-like flavoprotein
MLPEEKVLVVTSWMKVVPVARDTSRRFYARLFEMDPTTRSLFDGSNLEEQQRKLIQAITTVVQGLDRLECIAPTLADLGQRHKQYGVADRHYDSVGEALLWTLGHGLGSEWTPQVAAAWAAAYSMISELMRAGVRERETQAESLPSRGESAAGSLDAGEPLPSPDWWVPPESPRR